MHRIWLQLYLQLLGATKLNQARGMQKCQAWTGFRKERCVGSPALDTCGSALAAHQAPPTHLSPPEGRLLCAGPVHPSLQYIVISFLWSGREPILTATRGQCIAGTLRTETAQLLRARAGSLVVPPNLSIYRHSPSTEAQLPPSFHSNSGASDCLSSCLSTALDPEGCRNIQAREAEPGEWGREEGVVWWRKPVETTTRTGDQEEDSSCNVYMLLLGEPTHLP